MVQLYLTSTVNIVSQTSYIGIIGSNWYSAVVVSQLTVFMGLLHGGPSNQLTDCTFTVSLTLTTGSVAGFIMGGGSVTGTTALSLTNIQINVFMTSNNLFGAIIGSFTGGTLSYSISTL